MNRFKTLGGGLLAATCWIYWMGAMAAVPYFNWQYARDNGFVSWLFLGEVVGTAKGIVWPYFAVRARTPAHSWNDDEKENARHIFAAADASQAATRLGNAGPAYSTIPTATINEIQRLRNLALAESLLVRDEVLEKASPGMSKLWHEKYQRSLELQIRAFDHADAPSEMAGSALFNEWIEWLNANRKNIRIPM